MKHLDDDARYFSLAFLAEIAARGRGIQKELAQKTGISPSLITDLKSGRTACSYKKRQALAEALGHSYADLIAKGRILAGEEPESHDEANPSGNKARNERFRLKIKNLRRSLSNFRHRASVLAQKLITIQEKHIVFQEKYIAAQDEIMRLRLENEILRRSGWGSEGLGGPPARGGRTAPVADAE